jgi:8-oxo-dGTP pyrophosphatase MutT (NUDIX family)
VDLCYTGRVRAVTDIDWTRWVPTDVAVLLFVIRAGEALLIHKKRGLGAGKINAPGGRIEPGESPEAAAVRETQEEVCVTPAAPRRRGHLRFQFVDGYALECHVLSSDAFEGEPRETEEATPLWSPLHDLPYDRMWADDRMWIPLMLAGRPFRGRFVFDGELMLDHALDDDDPASRLFEQLGALGVSFDVAHHPPVFTVEQAKQHRPAGEAGAHVKNLFVRNKKGEAWLVTALEDRPIDLKALGRRIGAGHLSFASFDRLRRQLGVEPGSVTPLAAMNDAEGAVRVVLDAAVVAHERVFVHPLTNDRTIALASRDLVRFLEATGHAPQVVSFDDVADEAPSVEAERR